MRHPQRTFDAVVTAFHILVLGHLYWDNDRRMYKFYISHRICYVQRLNFVDEHITLMITSRITNEVEISCCWNQADLLLLLFVPSWFDLGTQECNGSTLPASLIFPHKYRRSCLVIRHLLLTRSPYDQIGKTYRYTEKQL